MVVQCLPPGMQHREKPDVCAQVVRIACHSQEGLGHGLKEEGILLANPQISFYCTNRKF